MHPVCVLLQASNHTCVLCFTFFLLYSFIHSFILHLFILNIYNLVIVLFNLNNIIIYNNHYSNL